MLTVAEREARSLRQQAILALLFFAPGQTRPVRSLRIDLENNHGQVASTDRVRADLTWLDDIGLVRYQRGLATLTERGADVLAGRARMPGDGRDDGAP